MYCVSVLYTYTECMQSVPIQSVPILRCPILLYQVEKRRASIATMDFSEQVSAIASKMPPG